MKNTIRKNYMEFVARVDVPGFNITKGAHYIVDDNHPFYSLCLNTEIFEPMNDPDKILKVGDSVIMDGKFIDGKVPNMGSSVRVKTTLADISGIEPSPTGYNIILHGLNGRFYHYRTKSICRDHQDNKCLNTKVKIYWFISSAGIISRTYTGKNDSADLFRKRSGNMFDTLEQAHVKYDEIMGHSKPVS